MGVLTYLKLYNLKDLNRLPSALKSNIKTPVKVTWKQ